VFLVVMGEWKRKEPLELNQAAEFVVRNRL
jgi:hypothetical protein